MANLPMAVYGLTVPAGDVAIKARPGIPAAFRITMAAIDPSAKAQSVGTTKPSKARATLKIIRQPLLADFYDDSDLDDDESDFDEDEMNALLAEEDEESSEDDEDVEQVNGGPSDPSKSKKARKAAAAAEIRKELESAMDLDEIAAAGDKVNGKGKGKVAMVNGTIVDDDEEEDEEDDDEELDSDDESDDLELEDIDEPEEFVICTLDPENTYQQPLDITVGEDERVWFKVSGTHTIYLTGNYVEPSLPGPSPYDDDEEESDYDSEDEDDYDLTPDEDELDIEGLDSEDELDDLEDPRITEVEEDDDEAEAPALVAPTKQEKASKGKNKRSAEDSVDNSLQTLDEMISTSAATNGDAKLSKKQAKKLKNNAGQPVAAAEKDAAKAGTAAKETKAPDSVKSDKKVSFAEKLEQGPTPSSPATTPAASTGPRVVQGVTIDVKKVGEGAEAKKGDRVGMRYIGKLEKTGKVFDSNKKGKPFSFKLGVGEVIKGWDVGVQGVRVGGERRLTIPAHLAYGGKAQPGIPANSTLVFDIKCVEIGKK